ncbi:MAG: NADH:ubiquinone oxidoreductase subunit NDUFA12 [Rhodobiaceae bacterium]|nr:NADH:ubiquinone oxidoreductase subunit NDUFA12 [Rhodobiaceae bacterium]
MRDFILQLFTWWNGQTMGTRFFTWRKGERVGTDEFGNVYYRAKNVPPLGERRWVIYKGVAEPSHIPPGWHGWIHHRTDVSPADDGYKPREWQKPWVPNMTGTAAAYRPDGSAATPAKRPAATGDYEAWSPEG